jgi:hypothetical protein
MPTTSARCSGINHVEAGEQRDAEDLVEADTLEHETHELADEQKFVGGVDVKKDAESEEDFIPTPEAASFEETSKASESKPAKKTAAKQS